MLIKACLLIITGCQLYHVMDRYLWNKMLYKMIRELSGKINKVMSVFIPEPSKDDFSEFIGGKSNEN